jgi:hypothetical protein
MTFAQYVQLAYGYSPADLEPTEVRGSWRVKAGCPGGAQCRHAFRVAGYLCDGTTPLFVRYAEWDRTPHGKFQRPYREWERQRTHTPETPNA